MKNQRWSSPWVFCVLTFAWSWLWLAVIALTGQQANLLLQLLAMAGPG